MTAKRRVFKLFECAKLPPTPKPKPVAAPTEVDSLSGDKPRLSEWHKERGGLALTVFQRYARTFVSRVPEQEECMKQTVSSANYMSHILASHFTKAKELDGVLQVYRCFLELALVDGGRMEYMLAVAHAANGEFYIARQFLVKAVAESKFDLLPNHLNKLLEHAPTLNAKSFALRSRLCSTPQELTQLFGLADQYCLLPSSLLQDEFIKKGTQLLQRGFMQNSHILHGWLSRLHHPKTRFVQLPIVPEYRPISQTAEMTCCD
ncbi:hypothetical protein L0F63_004057 [Massospora cicadina]|nr:hypothetical protein L0F63_004057 [Massospora cicadina]